MIAAGRTQADRAPAAPTRPLPPRRHDAGAERDADRVARFGSPAPPVAGAVARGHGGRPLERAVREWAEPRVGFDLEAVRIHDDAESHAVAGERHARALASGGDVLFARGAYRPGTPDGRELLLHELAHLAQQAGGTAATQHQDDAPRTGGIGRTPPEAEYTVADAPATGPEDLAVLFPHDEATPETGFRERFQALLRARTGPVLVRIHGYASGEGEPGYNVNLSAHRAVAARGAIFDLLPAGSRVELVAHGETAAFGEAPGNRRAGIAIADLPAPGGVTLDADRWLRNHPGLLGEGLRLEPLRLPPVIDWQIGDPTTVIGRPPAIDLRPLPLSYLEERIPWGEFHGVARARGATLAPGDQALILRHYQTYYPLAAALARLNPTPWGPTTADDVMSIFTGKLIDNALKGDRPNAIEAFNRELERQGLPTPTTIGGGISF